MVDPTVRGRFVWHELMTTDVQSGGAFFEKVAGWKTQPFDGSGSYTIFMSGKLGQAGLMELPDEAREAGASPNWLIYIGTPDVDETARQALALGATIIKPPADIPSVGRFAVVQDPQGAVFCIFTPLSQAQEERDAQVGEFSWHELSTTDWRSALSFYRQLFGWEETGANDMGPMGTYVMFGHHGRTLGGMMNRPAAQSGPPAWLAYIRVPDATAAVATIKRQGGVVLHGPAEVPGGDLIVMGLDPQGAVFAVHSVKAAAKPARAKAGKKKPAGTTKAAPARRAASRRRVAAKKIARKTAVRKKAAPAKKARRTHSKRTAPKPRRATKVRSGKKR